VPPAGYRTALMGKYLNGYDPADPPAPGWDVWDVAGNGYGEFDYSLNQNGAPYYYGNAPGDYLTDVLSAKATSFIASSAARHKPFMLEVATFVPAGRTVTWLASNVDLAPTFETLAGLKIRKTIDGHSLAALWHGQRPTDWRQVILIEHHGPDDRPGDPDAQVNAQADPPSYGAVRTENALYVVYGTGYQEYYDTATDPLELDNVASQGVPPELRKALAALENCHNGVTCWAAAHLP
jgi:arylsulfatase A-like enzyme